MPQGHVIDIMIIGFLQLTVLQFWKANSLGVIDLSLQHHPYFNPQIIQKKHIHKACRKNISAFYSLYSIIFYTFAVKILANDAEVITSLPQRNKKQILLAKTTTIWKMAKEKSKGIWSVMVL